MLDVREAPSQDDAQMVPPPLERAGVTSGLQHISHPTLRTLAFHSSLYKLV